MVLPLVVVALGASPVCGAKAPEDALRRLEDAYRARDIELAVACKDFEREAAMMLGQLKSTKDAGIELVQKAAQTLELAYRAEIARTGLPDMKGVQCAVVKKQPGPGDLVTLTERCRWPDGSKSEDRVAVASSSAGWRVVVTE